MPIRLPPPSRIQLLPPFMHATSLFRRQGTQNTGCATPPTPGGRRLVGESLPFPHPQRHQNRKQIPSSHPHLADAQRQSPKSPASEGLPRVMLDTPRHAARLTASGRRQRRARPLSTGPRHVS